MKRFLFILAVVPALICLSACAPTCGNEIVTSVSSPSGSSKAVVFNRNCGATTGFNTQVSVVPASSAPEGGGNALILGDTVPFTIRWVPESELSVAGLGSAKVFKQEPSVAGVAIAYGK